MSSRQEKYQQIRDLVSSHLHAGPKPSAKLTALITQKFELSKAQTYRYLARFTAEGLITTSGRGKGKTYKANTNAGALPRLLIERHLLVADASLRGEDSIYQNDLVPVLSQMKPEAHANALVILRHIFTEMLNNALDHAAAQQINFALWDSARTITGQISDDGTGAFATLRDAFQLPTLFEAVAELAKGRRTSMPSRHAGEGIFFSSRLVDTFNLSANGLEYSYRAVLDDWSLAESSGATENQRGTKVDFSIAKDSSRSPEQVYATYTDADYEFTSGGQFNVLPYTIKVSSDMISRSEAKRLLAGAEKFRNIVMDFRGVNRIGQGFADEVFRVFRLAHPKLHIEPKHMQPAVEFMVRRALKAYESMR